MIRSLFKRWLFKEELQAERELDLYSFLEGSPIRNETLQKIQLRWRDEGLIR